MNSPELANNRCTIVVADLFALINAQRKLLRRSPIEDRAMASRCTLRFSVDRQRGVDFSAERINMGPDDVAVLEKIVNDQFGVYFNGDLSKLCVHRRKPAAEPERIEPGLDPFIEFTLEPEKTGLMAKIKRLFGGK